MTTTPSPTPTIAPVLSAQLPSTAAAVAEQMRHGLSVARSAQVSVAAKAAGPAAARGVLTLIAGTPTAADITLTGARVITVNSVSYAKLAGRSRYSPLPLTGALPAALRTVRMRWLPVRTLADPAQLLQWVRHGSLRLLGRGRIGGVAAAHYRVSDRPAGVARLDLWVDGGGRPVSAAVVGTSGHPSGTVRFTAYDAAVSITAPSGSALAR